MTKTSGLVDILDLLEGTAEADVVPPPAAVDPDSQGFSVFSGPGESGPRIFNEFLSLHLKTLINEFLRGLNLTRFVFYVCSFVVVNAG